MNGIKVISFGIIIIPILNVGCTQSEVSAIKPSIDNDKNKTTMVIPLEKSEQSPVISLLGDEENLSGESDESSLSLIEENLPPNNEFQNLALAIDDESYGVEENSTSEELTDNEDIGSDWVEVTKEEEIVLTAQEFLGTKYVWAANGPDCFDCSGFTKYVFKEHGLTLPRYSGHQAKVGIKVSYDELKIGDLVFFDTEKHYSKKVNHVGIYIGDGKFIHASSAKKKVTITSFKKKKFYRDRFLWGRRVITDDAYASL